jgi:hypothetical protein
MSGVLVMWRVSSAVVEEGSLRRLNLNPGFGAREAVAVLRLSFRDFIAWRCVSSHGW